jgi:hypothetical protein
MIAFLCEEGWSFLIQDIFPCLGRPYKIFTREDWTEACLAEADIVVSAHGLRPWINDAAMAAAKKDIPSLLLQDGVVEWCHTYQSKNASEGLVRYQPCHFSHFAAFGPLWAQLVQFWNPAVQCHVIGNPRFDGLQFRGGESNGKLVVATARTPFMHEAQKREVKQALIDIKETLETLGVEPVWRIPEILAEGLGVGKNSSVSRKQKTIYDDLEGAAGLLSFRSTLCIEAMLLGIPVCVVDYSNLPQFFYATWNISRRDQIAPTVQRLLVPSPPELLHQSWLLSQLHPFHSGSSKRAAELIETLCRK